LNRNGGEYAFRLTALRQQWGDPGAKLITYISGRSVYQRLYTPGRSAVQIATSTIRAPGV